MKPLRVALYARVSTAEQSADSQLAAMREYCNRRGFVIVREFVDQVTGDVDARSLRRRSPDKQYRQLMVDAKKDHFQCVMVWRYDRLARSLVHLLASLDYFRSWGVQFISLTEDIDTTTPQGRLFFTIVASFAEYERSIIKDRVRAGLANAKAKGVVLGRPRDRSGEAKIFKLAAKGLNQAEIARQTGRSRAGVWLVLNRDRERSTPAP